MRLAHLRALAGLTLRDPPAALAALRGLDLAMAQRWAVLAVAVCLSSVLAGLLTLGAPADAGGPVTALVRHPFALAGAQMAGVAIAAWLMAAVGRLFGGQGSFADALLVLAWIDLIVIAAQVAQVVLVLVLPPLAALAGLATVALYVVLLVRMTAALHGFANPFAVALGIAATVVLVGALVSLFLGGLGVVPTPETLP